jgi:hypothetical protein
MDVTNTRCFKRSSTRVALLLALLFAGAIATAEAQQGVSWTNQSNVAVRGSGLQKTSGCEGCDDAGAISRQMIGSGDGYVEFKVGEDYTFWLAGLSQRDGNTRFGNIDFAIRFNGNEWADILEDGQYVGGDTDYRAGDVFRVEVVGGRVRYLKNGQVMYVSQRRPQYPLVLDVSLGSMGASIQNARISTRGNDLASFMPQDEFDRLDRNYDGVVSRREWNGTRGAFNQRDLNRDGVLTPDELGVQAYNDRDYNRDYRDYRDNRDVVGTAGEFVTVSATERWTDSGVTVRSGDLMTFEAEGTIQMSPDPNDSASPAGSRRSAPGALVRQVSAGTLIARIGNGTPFVVGAQTRMRAPASGQLFLGVNDDYLGDNSGEFRVMVSIDRR